MTDLKKALDDISTIRGQLAASSAFQGYGPGAVAATGVIAVLVASGQAWTLGAEHPAPLPFFAVWIGVAIAAVAIIGTEMLARTRRDHSGLADDMLRHAAEQMLPAGAVGALLLVALWRVAPDALWMLPGLWQILVGLGVFASLRILPRQLALGGGFYVVAGFVTLALSAEARALSPWTMGLPFGIGQALIAGLLRAAPGGRDGRN
ncbi:hypothetical protein [Hansschlegelia sp.]|uniref:hypothetical protein n=1 Tax=Hansschlegelia sp. TaxID=2041892 RepID=UPI002BB9E9F5|nr:hypothetical protein [Hansschlegelia sp.]HVI29961.1 hypothetical protein [Hansschlegelia sp.]